ncbi:hypothetical protein [Granulicoccus sp. GXG6511]|uniref:hypothetical protein n=1 Tax=Granulicoccus sp. GXG6511 TaxID=3381351 RepID=UPI003D7D5021
MTAAPGDAPGTIPAADRAATIIELLDDAQRTRYFGHRAQVRAKAELAQAIGQVDDDVRNRRALSPALVTERAEMLAIHRRAAGVHVFFERLWWWVFFVLGWTFLGAGILAIVVGAFTGGLESVAGDWRFGDDLSSGAGSLVALSGVALVLSTLAGFARNAAITLGRRRSRGALLAWASDRPGQLARGVYADDRPNPYGGGCFRKAVGGCLLGVGAMIAVPLALALFLDFALGGPNTDWMAGGAVALAVAIVVAGLGYLILSPRLRRKVASPTQSLMWAYNVLPTPAAQENGPPPAGNGPLAKAD